MEGLFLVIISLYVTMATSGITAAVYMFRTFNRIKRIERHINELEAYNLSQVPPPGYYAKEA